MSTIQEKDTDLALLRALNAGTDFSMRSVEIAFRRPVTPIGLPLAAPGVSRDRLTEDDPSYGETDLQALFLVNDRESPGVATLRCESCGHELRVRRLALLIENKINASFTANQGIRYRNHSSSFQRDGLCGECCVLLVAPQEATGSWTASPIEPKASI